MSTTQVTGSEVFIYTVEATFPALSQDVVQGTLVDFFPSNVTYQLPPIEGSLQDIVETTVEGGVIVTFVYGDVVSGTTVAFSCGVQFGDGRRDGDVFTNSIGLYEDGVEVETATASPVTLQLTSDFSLKKYTITSENPKSGEEVLFRLILENQGDGGATVNDVLIIDTLPTGLVADLNYTVTGSDQSTSFPDTSLDGAVGTWVNNVLYFPLSSYSGEKYVIDVYTLVDSKVTPGDTMTNTAYWTLSDVEQNTSTSDITIYIDKVEGEVVKIGPYNAAVGGVIQYELFHRNTGTVAMTDYVVTEIAPVDLNLERLQCNSSTNSMDSYSIYVTTREDPATEYLVAENLSNDSPIYQLAEYIPDGTEIYQILWKSDEIKVSTDTSWMSLWGIISENAVVDSALVNTATLYGNSILGAVDASYAQITYLTGRSVLDIEKGFAEDNTFFYPLSEFTMYLKASGENGQIVDPIFVDILPKELAYISGNEYYQFYDGFTRTTYDSRNGDFPVPLPTITVVENWNDSEETLVRFDFTGYTLQYRGYLTVYFTSLVKLGSIDGFSNTGYLGNPTDDGIVYGTAYLDTMDLDDDGYVEEYIAASTPLEGIILYTSEFSIEKWVKGDLDLEYSKSGTCTSGGFASYELMITNNQEAQLSNLDVVDIFPYVGDTGVILVEESRGSQFPVYPVSVPTAKIVNILTGEEVSQGEITIFYSISSDPQRFSITGDTIGTGEWTDTPPSNLATIAALRIQTAASLVLEPYERLVITVTVVTPEGTPEGLIAYNSFAVQGDVTTSEGTNTLLPTEPVKVALVMAENTGASFQGFVWYDSNNDGKWDDDEVKVNGVTVELYDDSGNFLEETVTVDDYLGESGYYSFSNLDTGSYQLKFIPDQGDTLTLQDLVDTYGSRPDPITGFTPIYTLTDEEQSSDVNGGLATFICPYPVIEASDVTLTIGDSFDPLDYATATNCQGENISADLIVTENTVDTQVAGVYTVTYEVTDSQDQTTTKTITVTVEEEPDPRTQAITDLMESIALGEAGIRSILDGEGAKIQKAVALDLTTEELIAVNTSVESMVKHLTTLEQVLRNKLELALESGY